MDKERIIQITINGIRKQGVSFSIDRLSLEAKMSKKTIYGIFSSKTELGKGIFEYLLVSFPSSCGVSLHESLKAYSTFLGDRKSVV